MNMVCLKRMKNLLFFKNSKLGVLMKIGIDIDGVIFNFEREILTYAELFNFLELKRDGEVNRQEHYLKDRFGWSDKERSVFFNKYALKLTEQTAFMAGAVDIINMLKADGHKLIIVSARGELIPEMKDVALKKLESAGLVFDKYYFKQTDKLKVAIDEKLDFMIDDVYQNCKRLSENGVKTIYFKDVDAKDLKQSETLTKVSNWGEIYRIIKTAADENKSKKKK